MTDVAAFTSCAWVHSPSVTSNCAGVSTADRARFESWAQRAAASSTVTSTVRTSCTIA